eukprot:CAMPEP_0194559774 /NCGR_PEP_ID=MMETSP0292-20121207/1203_1 /TAXON_ID=39354 /ORGANISM="Heterosigma akashiwo, Strain CCMP2393" /LENGTH=220 /DNA_ID=CAMNT_0039407787 /DNA_START=164 /DNA_END=826 /DNA_ORIENTATION=+
MITEKTIHPDRGTALLRFFGLRRHPQPKSTLLQMGANDAMPPCNVTTNASPLHESAISGVPSIINPNPDGNIMERARKLLINSFTLESLDVAAALHILEVPLFLQAVSEYKCCGCDGEHQYQKYMEIVFLFIEINSQFEINISSRDRDRILRLKNITNSLSDWQDIPAVERITIFDCARSEMAKIWKESCMLKNVLSTSMAEEQLLQTSPHPAVTVVFAR